MRRLLGLVALLAAMPVVAAHAQEQRLAGRISDDARVEIDMVLDSARGEGLPVEPLVDRALEGAAKGAGADLIVRAVRRLREELRIARAAFGDDAAHPEVTAGASALRAGATQADLVRLREIRQVGRMTVPAAVLADLIAAGVPSDTAIAAVMVLAGDLADAQYLAFRRNVEQDIALGASPSSALSVRLSVFSAAEDNLSPNGVPGTASPPPRKRKP